MKDVNSITIVGRLIKDAEAHMFTEDFGVIQFTIAVNRPAKKDGKWEDEVFFFSVKTTGNQKRVDTLLPLLTKGKQICASGFLRQDRWEKNGQKNSTVVIMADTLQLLSAPKSNEADYSGNDLDLQEDTPF